VSTDVEEIVVTANIPFFLEKDRLEDPGQPNFLLCAGSFS